jgi:hypothetical protein
MPCRRGRPWPGKLKNVAREGRRENLILRNEAKRSGGPCDALSGREDVLDALTLTLSFKGEGKT